MQTIREDTLEQTTLAWFKSLGYQTLYGPTIAPGEPAAERDDYRQAILEGRLREAVTRLNPAVSPASRKEALRRVLRPDSPSLVENNRALHHWLVDGIEVQARRPDGIISGERVYLIDYQYPKRNDWLVVNQYTVQDGQHTRRPDVVVFVNGLPLAVLELKNPVDEQATIWTAYNQLQTYKDQIPTLFVPNEVLVISDGLNARFGSLTSNREWFLPWRTIDGEELAPTSMLELEVLVRGLFDPRWFLDYFRGCVAYDARDGGEVQKIVAGYHQFHAVRQVVESTVNASRPDGDHRGGVIWHTQGAGKSLSMVFFTGRIMRHPAMASPTVVVITDRNDLDDQLFGTFSACQDALPQNPVQATSRHNLRQLLRVASGGIVFTTVQKFFPDQKGQEHPLLSDRSNIVVIADEALHSQYDFIDGFARHMRDALPNATFVGFTGTPIELTDKNTRAVFGDYISIYDIQQAVLDGATVPIYYESRLAKLALDEDEKPRLDETFEEVAEGQEESEKERLKSKWAALEALAGTEKRVNLIAQDIVTHYEQRCEALHGKAMIVCMSRRICVEMYNAIVKLRPEWHGESDDEGILKIVMSGSASDPLGWQAHIRNKPRRESLSLRFRNPKDHFRVVIVRDMWLTGFDAPSLHTMYADKPMRGHGLMQTIARVNRVFKDKPGGLVVDYIGLAAHLKRALSTYVQSGGKGQTAIDQAKAVAIMDEKYEICYGIMLGYDWSDWTHGDQARRLSLLPSAQEHVLAQEDGKKRFVQAVTELSKAFALAVPHERALAIRDDVAFFQAVKAALSKRTLEGAEGHRPDWETESAIQQLVSRALTSDEVIDIFAAAGLQKPDISILSDEFLAEVRGLPHKNLAADLLQRLLNDEIRVRERRNVVQARSFREMLENAVRAYHNHAIQTVELIERLIEMAKEMQQADQRGEELNLSQEEIAFYDALAANRSAVEVLGDEKLMIIAQELVERVRRNVTIDWTVRANVRAKLRALVKRTLRKYGYPPDKQKAATQLVLEQAEVLCADWTGEE